MRKIGKDDIRRMVIEEVASAKREVAARKSGTLSRERLREIILEEVALHNRSRQSLQESQDMRVVPKLSLVRALLGEADDKGGKALSFADGGQGKLKVGGNTYHVYDGDPKDEDYLPQFNLKVATQVLVKPDAFAAYFKPIDPVKPYKVDFMPGAYNPASDIDPNLPGTVGELMKRLADGVAMQYVPLKSADHDLVTLISPEQLARFRKQKGEPKEETGEE